MHVPASVRFVLIASALLLASPLAPAVAPPIDFASPARVVLQRHCHTCHGGDRRAKGGLSQITDLSLLVSRGLVMPGQPHASLLYQRVHAGEMPPPGKRNRISASDRAVLHDWIRAGAPTGSSSTVASRPGEDDILKLIRTDLRRWPARQRRFFRYVTLAHLAGRPAREQETIRYALAKLVNSLSWHPRLTVPAAIDHAPFVYRIDIRHYRWTARQWDRLAATYPYRASEPPALLREAAALAGCDQPVLRADWFIATASRPPFYHDFLQLPASDRSLERLLQVDVRGNLEDETALRAGFNGSGVARSNRLIERHDALHGAYWRSYDFSDNTGRQNLFENPLGPAPAGTATFRHGGGEIIFHLPNGLQGYLLVDAAGTRIDRAPADIVRDPRRPDGIVETGLSCIGCHVQGIIPKDDQVRAHVLKNRRAFTEPQREVILALYAPSGQLRSAIREDNQRFAAALRRLVVPAGEPEPVSAAVQRYEEVLDLGRAADETGSTVETLVGILRKSEELARSLGPLLARRGTVQRQVFEEVYSRLLAEPPVSTAIVASAPTVPSEFRGHGTAVRALAWAPDGKSFASAGADGVVRVWDILSGKHRPMVGRIEEPAALAFSPDGRRLLAGGADRVLVIWEPSTGRRLGRLVGHTAGIRAVAFSPDGKRVLSAGEDRTIRVWNLDTKRQTHALTGHVGTITALAISFDGKLVLSAGIDRTLRLWDLAAERVLARHESARDIRAVAFSQDGKSVFTGGADGAVSVRAVDRFSEPKRLCLQSGSVVSLHVAWMGALLSASVHSVPREQSLRVIDLATERARSAGPIGAVEATAVSRDGRALLAIDNVIHLVSVPR